MGKLKTILIALAGFIIALFAAYRNGVKTAAKQIENEQIKGNLNVITESKKIDNQITNLDRAGRNRRMQKFFRKQ